jgi:hypothetical protein
MDEGFREKWRLEGKSYDLIENESPNQMNCGLLGGTSRRFL